MGREGGRLDGDQTVLVEGACEAWRGEMIPCRRWRRPRALVLALALTLGASTFDLAVSSFQVSVARAQETEKRGDKNDLKSNKNIGNDDDADHFARGQVIGINTLADPPELTLASFDGEMLVRVLKTDEIALNGVKLCYHIQLEGEKIHEYLFEATKLEVEEKQKC
jgi:hypothetical protein